MSARILLAFALLSLLFVGACSDGSDGSGGSSSEVLTGFLFDSAVSGVAYETPTRAGVTGPDGSFRYTTGEKVRFSLGETLLGEVPGKDRVTPFDLADSPVVTGTKNATRALENQRDPFHAVINIAVLLQSLDRDADMSNGIEITPEVAALFTQVNLDVKQHWSRFSAEFELRRAIAQANARNLFGEPHGAIPSSIAIAHLYRSLDIDARIFGRNLEETDSDTDSTPDSVESWKYDVNGNESQNQFDEEGDGVADRIHNYSYDSIGRLIRVEVDEGGNGNFRIIEVREYDPGGNLVHIEKVDDEYDVLLTASYQYDTSGNRTRVESVNFHGGEAVFHAIETREFDAYGDVTRREEDSDGDGTPDHIDTWQYDAVGNLTRYEEDAGADGTPDHIDTWQYDAHHNTTQHALDIGGDGIIEVTHHWRLEYNDKGELVLAEHTEDDSLPIAITNYQYDSNGNLTRVESNREIGSRAESLWIETYEYDMEGNLVRETQDDIGPDPRRHLVVMEYDSHGNVIRDEMRLEGARDSDGTMRWIHVRIKLVDENGGQITRYERDEDADDRPDSIVIYETDEHGNLTQEYEDLDGDGTPDELRIIDYLYELDADGNLVREEIDEGGNGTTDFIANYGYEPTGWGHLFSSQ